MNCKNVLWILILSLLFTMSPTVLAVESEYDISKDIEFLNIVGLLPKDFNIEAAEETVTNAMLDAYMLLLNPLYPSNSYFDPNAPVKYGTAVKVLLKELGYYDFILAKGGNIVDFLDVAKNTGLSSGINNSWEQQLTVKTLIQLIKNAFDTDVMEVSSVSDRGVDFNVKKGYTLSMRNFKIKKNNGIVMATDISYVDRESSMGKGYALIGDETVACQNVNIQSLLGYHVTYYARFDDDSLGYLLYAYADSRNEITEIEAKNLLKDNPAYSLSRIVYDDNGLTKKLDLPKDIDVIYNGRCFFGFTLDTLKPVSGTITAVDNNGDGILDVLIVNEYKNYIVASTDSGTYTVTDKEGHILSFEPDKKITLTDFNGKEVDFSYISPWSILSVEQSDDKSVTKVVVTKIKLGGIINEMDLSEDGYILLGDVKHPIAESWKSAQYVGKTVPVVGRKYVVYLDKKGEIAAIDDRSEAIRYGFLFNCDYKKQINRTAQFKIFTEEGEWEVFDAAKKVLLNGTVEYAANKILDSSLLKNQAGNTIRQLIKYETNQKGEIKQIYTGKESASFSGDELRKNEVLTGAYYKATVRSLNSTYAISDDTIIFSIPKPVNGEYDENAFYVVTSTSLSPDQQYDVTVYDINAARVPGALTIDNGTLKEGRPMANLLLIKSVSSRIVDGTAKKVINCFHNGVEKSFVAIDDSLIEGFKTGDMIVVRQNVRGEIDSVTTVWKNGDPLFGEKYLRGTNIRGQLAAIFGPAVGKDGSIVSVQTGESTFRPCYTVNAKVYIYDRQEKNANAAIRLASAQEIFASEHDSHSTLIALLSSEIASDIVIVK